MQSHIGELAALTTALCWALNGVAFEAAGKRVGSTAVNYMRIVLAFIFLSLTSWAVRGLLFPIDASGSAWFWLTLSGLIGFVMGDMFLLEAFVLIGSRISMLIMSAAPPLTVLISFLVMGERVTFFQLFGIGLIMAGICMVILSRHPVEEDQKLSQQGKKSQPGKMGLSRSPKGVFYAGLGALGQALGLITSKLGMGDSYSAIAATQIRALAAVVGLALIITFQKKWPEISEAFKDKKALGQIAAGSVFGPFIGVGLSLLALQYTKTGIVSSITSLSPVFIIPIAILTLKEKILPKEVLGALVSVVGVAILFI